jgi:hypothetical protein
MVTLYDRICKASGIGDEKDAPLGELEGDDEPIELADLD